MVRHKPKHASCRAHTLVELVVAMTASSFLLAGMGSVMFIARQVAYTPSDATRRAKTAEIVAQICDELRYATLLLQATPQVLEFVVADRNSDGISEKIRYSWSGSAGDPLQKTINNGTAVDVLASVNSFNITLNQTQKTATYTTTSDSSESTLLNNSAVASASYRDIDLTTRMAQVILPAAFPSVPANAVSWTATRLDFYGQQNGIAGDTLVVQIRPANDPYDLPTSEVLGQATIAEASIVNGWNTVTFSPPVRELAFNRKYNVVFLQTSGAGKAALIAYNDSLATGVNDSTDAGASWRFMTTRQTFGRLYGTYTTPGTTHSVPRNYVANVRIALQAGDHGYARVDASAPLGNMPELLAAYWRTDFDRDPTSTNGNGDAVADWALAGGGTFDNTNLVNGVWAATGAIETRPLADFTTTTTVEVRCRNTSVGGNGAVVCINADRQGGQYAPLLVYVQRQADGTQTLTLSGKTSDAATKQLFSRSKLPAGFIRYQLTVLPSNNLVNIHINGEDQGAYAYPTYTPMSATDRFLSAYANGSSAEFDYIDVRVN